MNSDDLMLAISIEELDCRHPDLRMFHTSVLVSDIPDTFLTSYTGDMSNQHIHFPFTTAQQRKFLFETWEETGNVSEACRKAHVGRATFYYWKKRFNEGGYSGLEEFASRAPKNHCRTSLEIEEKTISLRREHPEWGKRRIADALAKANNWVPLTSPNTVKRILRDAGL